MRIARYTIVEAKGAYDVQLQLKPSSSFSVQPPANAFKAGPGEIGKNSSGPEARDRSTPPVRGTSSSINRHSNTASAAKPRRHDDQAGIQQSRTYNNTVFNAYNPYYIATLNLA